MDWWILLPPGLLRPWRGRPCANTHFPAWLADLPNLDTAHSLVPTRRSLSLRRLIRGKFVPASVRRADVWQLHEVYSDDSTKQWVQQGCRSAGIGCLECKKPVIDAVNAELAPMRQRALEYEEQPELIFSLLAEGAERAADVAEDTLRDVRSAMGLNYR